MGIPMTWIRNINSIDSLNNFEWQFLVFGIEILIAK